MTQAVKSPVVLIGIGEMAGVFARGFLRAGYPVYPVTRDTDLRRAAEQIPDPALVLISVAENDLQPVLTELPGRWCNKLGLLQNELLPRDWQRHDLKNPTVISVWFEKKKGQDVKVLVPSPVYGPRAEIIHEAMSALEIPCRVVPDSEEMLFELVRKNLYILTTNIAGLETGGNVAQLWRDHEPLARSVITDVLAIQQQLTGMEHDQEALIKGMLEAFEGDPEHKCMGRSAPARLQRALQQARDFGLTVETLSRIGSKHLAAA